MEVGKVRGKTIFTSEVYKVRTTSEKVVILTKKFTSYESPTTCQD